MTAIAYVNGKFTPAGEAGVSIFDRGFLFGDGVYEVAAVLDGKLVDNDAHMARLGGSLREIMLATPEPLDRIRAIQAELIARNDLQEGLVYLQITRGAAPTRDFGFPPDTIPTLVMFTQAKNIINSPTVVAGIAVKTLPDIRWARRDIKSTSLLAQVLAKQAALAEGCQEAWMIDSDGAVTEGASSTAFIITKQATIVTRPNSTSVLPGCTGKAVVALAERRSLRIERRAFSVAEALDAAEAFLTSATTFVLPVVAIDGSPVGQGVPGEMTRLLRQLYIEAARATAT
ncbi:MAG: D-amino-acid transaminase [Methylocystis sp.]